MKYAALLSYIKYRKFYFSMCLCFHIWNIENSTTFIYEQGSAYFIYESGKISFTSYMKIEQLNKVWSLLFMIGWDCVLFAVRTFRPDLVLSALGHGDPVTGLASVWKLRACVWASVLRCLGSGAGRASLGAMLSSEWASLALPGVSAVVGLLVSPLPGSLSLGLLETPQVGSSCCC